LNARELEEKEKVIIGKGNPSCYSIAFASGEDAPQKPVAET
jgi:hypothetical protein